MKAQRRAAGRTEMPFGGRRALEPGWLAPGPGQARGPDLGQRGKRAADSFLAHPAVANSRLRHLEQRITHRTALTAAGHGGLGLVHGSLLLLAHEAERISQSTGCWLRWEISSHTVPPMPITIDHIIERLGGADAAARLTGVGTEAVRKWRQSRAIPSRHWPAVSAATGLSMADLQSVSPDQASATMSQATDT